MKTQIINEASAPANVRPSSVEETKNFTVTEQEIKWMVLNWNDRNITEAILKKYIGEHETCESFAATMLIEAAIREQSLNPWQIAVIAGNFVSLANLNGYRDGRAK